MVELKYPVIIDKNIIDQVVEDILKRLDKGIEECNKIIDDYDKPMDLEHNYERKNEIIEERLTGRLSTQSLINATAMKVHFEKQRLKLSNFMFMYNKSDY